MTIKTFDKPTLRALGTEIDAALAIIAERHGITLKRGGARFTAGEFTMKVEGACAVQAERDDALLRQMADSYGLDVAKVSPDGLKLIGYDMKRRTRPWKAIKAVGGNPARPYILNDAEARMRFAKAA